MWLPSTYETCRKCEKACENPKRTWKNDYVRCKPEVTPRLRHQKLCLMVCLDLLYRNQFGHGACTQLSLCMFYWETVGNSHESTFSWKICRNFAEKFSTFWCKICRILLQNSKLDLSNFGTKSTLGHTNKNNFEQKNTHHKLSFTQFKQYIEVSKLLHMGIETAERLLWLHKGLQALEVERLAEACLTFHTVIMTSTAVFSSNQRLAGLQAG